MHLTLGDTAKDSISGFEGTVIAIASYWTGCDQALLKPTSVDKKGEPRTGHWFDVESVVKTGVAKPLPHKASQQGASRHGGPRGIDSPPSD